MDRTIAKGGEIKWKKTLKHKRVFLYTGMIMTTPLLLYSLSGSFSHHSCYGRMKASGLGNAAFLCLVALPLGHTVKGTALS